MRELLVVAGFVVLLYVHTEILWTVFLEGAAPLTRLFAVRQVKLLQAIARRSGSRRPLLIGGPATLVTAVLLWTVLIWAGWALVFCGIPNGVVATADGRSATIAQRIYYAGDTVFTLGLGDYRPLSAPSQILTAIAAGTGFFLFGVALAYTVPIISAVTQKRQLGVCVWTLGHTPAQIIIQSWNGADTTALNPHLISLIPMLALLGENHLTYPALHSFYGSRRASALAPSVAVLDEALTILECGMQTGCSLDLPSLGASREAITEFLHTLKPALIAPSDKTPPVPSLKALRDVGVSVVDDATFRKAVAVLAPRRRLLLALVLNEGWDWDSVWPPAEQLPEESPRSLPVAVVALK